jgi:ubiquinone/menaquinone biosynthesis C-methylase UbiE
LKIQSALASISGVKVLDVATGAGDFIDTLMKALKNYDCFVGIDISQKDLTAAKQRFSGQPVTLMPMKAEALEFADHSFDTVGMAHSLHHLETVDHALAEMARVLKPGGTLIIEEEMCDGPQTEAQTTNTLQHTWYAQIDSLLGETHNPPFTKHRIEQAIRTLQFERVDLFESTRPVECLFCEKKVDCEDPKRAEDIASSLKEIDKNLRRLKQIADSNARTKLQKIGEQLKARNREFGNTHPPVLLAIGKKALDPAS